MIEVKRKNTTKGNYRLFVNGNLVTPNEARIYTPDNKKLTITVLSPEVSKAIEAHSFHEIPLQIEQLVLFPDQQEKYENGILERLSVQRNRKHNGVEVITNLDFNYEGWKQPWSVLEYKKGMDFIVRQNPTRNFILRTKPELIPMFPPSGIFFVTLIKELKRIIRDEVLAHTEIVRRYHKLTVAALLSELHNPNVERIIRTIEFPPEYHRSGVNILSYFADVLRHKNLTEDVKVSIEQNGLKVSLVIDSPTGQRELIEQTLEAYGMVVLHRQPPEFLTTDPYELAELKSQLRYAEVQIETQRELLAARNADVSSLRAEVKDTRAQVRHMQEQAGEDRARFMSLMEGLVSHNTALATGFKELAQQAAQAQNKALAGALKNLYKVVERGAREEDREEVLQNLTTIQGEDPGVFKQVSDILLSGALSNAAGNYMYSWLQFLVGSLPK